MFEIKKYYVGENECIIIQCPFCGKTRVVSVGTFRNKPNTVKVKCSCTGIFTIEIEFRRHYRKKVHLVGIYRPISVPVEKADICVITDISSGGIAIKVTNTPAVKVGEKLVVNFKLDDKKQSKIEQIVNVIHVDCKKGVIGGAFVFSKSNSQDKDIYFYLK